MRDFYVEVTRVGNGEDFTEEEAQSDAFFERAKCGLSWHGRYVSKVYAIDRDRFLVYDPGNGDYIGEGFEWVDFTRLMVPCCSYFDEETKLERIVKLFEED